MKNKEADGSFKMLERSSMMELSRNFAIYSMEPMCFVVCGRLQGSDWYAR